jgi:hypothetical protein
MNINKELQDIIQKNLPQAVGEELRIRLEQAGQAESDVKSFKEANRILTKDLNNWKENYDRLKEEMKGHMALDAREKEIAHREFELDLTLSKASLSTEKQMSKTLTDVLMGLVRNTEYRKAVTQDAVLSGGSSVSNGYSQTNPDQVRGLMGTETTEAK